MKLNLRHIISLLFICTYPILVGAKSDSLLTKVYYSQDLSQPEKIDSIIGLYQNLNPTNKRLLFADEIIELAQKENDENWLGRANYLKANDYIQLGEAELADKYYKLSLEFFESAQPEFITLVYYGLGNTASLQQNDSTAIYYYTKALLEYKMQHDTLYMGYTLLNLINSYNHLNQLDSAAYYITILDSLTLSFPDPLTLGGKFGYRSLLHAKKKEYKEAVNNFKTAASYLDQAKRRFDKTAFQLELADIFLEQKDYKEASIQAQESYHTALKAGYKDQVEQAAAILAKSYAGLGDYSQAYRYTEMQIQYKDSILNESAIRKLANQQADYEIEKKQLELDLVKKKSSLIRISLISVSILLALVLLLVFIMYRFNRHRRKINHILQLNRKELLEQKCALEEANATKDKIFSIVSHDLRVPIHGASGLAEFFKEQIASDNKKDSLRLAQLLADQMKNLSGLLDNLLEWSANQQGVIAYHPEAIDLHALVQNQMDIFHYTAQSKQITLENHLAPEHTIYADRNSMATVCRNILSNAIKFTLQEGIVKVRAEQANGSLTLAIEDTGIGMPPERVQQLFELTSLKHTYGTSNEKGIGLGLRLVYEFVELNKGKIWVESEEGKGSTFFVKMPGH